jgi:xylan 1,4-beta-xylosidase
LQVKGLTGSHRVKIYRMDRDHGSPLPAWEAMGKPRYPTRQQLETLRKAAELPAAESRTMVDGKITLTIAPQSLFLIEVN